MLNADYIREQGRANASYFQQLGTYEKVNLLQLVEEEKKNGSF